MAACRTCGASFTWRKVAAKWHAIDPDGQTNHWSYCEGRKIGRAGSEPQRLEIRGKEIAGEHYRPSCGRCDLPPWNTCACSALLTTCAKDESEGISALEADAPRAHCEGTAEAINAEADSRMQLALQD